MDEWRKDPSGKYRRCQHKRTRRARSQEVLNILNEGEAGTNNSTADQTVKPRIDGISTCKDEDDDTNALEEFFSNRRNKHSNNDRCGILITKRASKIQI